ncbi:MAG TPA: NEW3 domain-containing protein [Pyrinomonadaceae bacterium]|jgi:M6 family metalloprotease-like protein
MKKNLLRILLGLFLVFLCLAVTDFRTLADKGNEKNSAGLSDLTVKVVDLSTRLEKENGFARGEFESLAAARFAKMSELAESDPSEVLRVALPEEVLAKMPKDLQAFFEKREEIEGELEVFYECDGENEILKYFLKTDKERLPVYFAKKPEKEILTGSTVRVKSLRVGDSLLIDDGTSAQEFSSSQAVESLLPNTFGEQKLLVLLVNFQNNQTQPMTVDQINNLFFNTANNGSITNYYREVSYGRTWMSGDTLGWTTLPINSGDCAGTSIASYAKQAAQNAGYNLSAYNKFVYLFPNMNCSYSGQGTLGGNETWINGTFTRQNISHELGHNFGLQHSRYMDCDSGVLGGSCTTIEYGHIMDTMGGGSGHFHPYQKERLGWLNYSDLPSITTVTQSGNYTIAPMATNSASAPKALKILKSVDSSGNKTWYYVELRRNIGFDAGISNNANLMNGVMITMDKESNTQENYMLDMTPETTTRTDPALTVNRTYTDSAAGISITPLAVSDSGATVSVSFGSQPVPTCVLANPTVTASPTQTQWIGAGSSVSYTVTINNNNPSGCSANTFNIQNSLPSGWSSTVAVPSLYAAPGASATTTMQVVAPNSAANGFYTLAINASNSANPVYTASVTGNLSVYSSLAVNVTSDAASYNSTQTIYLTANVSANGSPISGANVNFTITRPNGTIAVTGTAVSNSNGVAVYSYKFNRKKDTNGTYQVSANASLNGISGTARTSFVLLK